MGITLKEIAKMANVHRSTVDKVLHDREGVSDEVRKRIKQIIKETGYTPNSLGQALQKKSEVIRIAAVLLKVDALNILKEGINQALKAYEGFNIDIQYNIINYFDEAAQLSVLQSLLKDRIDGIILSPIHTESIQKAIDKIIAAGIPVVTTMNFDIPSSNRLCFVGQDALRAGMIAASLVDGLLSGRGKVLLITATGQTDTISYSEDRRVGFENMIKSEYPNIEIAGYIVGYDDPIIIEREVSSLLKDSDWPDGIFITGGGVGVVGKLLKEYDKEHRIKVVCFECYPEIIQLIQEGVIHFTIDSNMKSQGYLPIEILINYLVYRKKPPTSEIYTNSEIVVKGSLHKSEKK
ncbi:MAG: LacI family DNA-binding transcriptional regulator [Christensenellales bacterium]